MLIYGVIAFIGSIFVGAIVADLFEIDYYTHMKFWITVYIIFIVAATIVGFIIPAIPIYNRSVEIKKSNEAIERLNERIRVENRENRQRRQKQIQMLTQERDRISQSCDRTLQVLDAYYGKNIVAKKYQHNLVAISSFYEYLNLGRTRSLELNGSDKGAYNIFENEIRLNVIIQKLDEVIQHLEQIEQNQYMLYTAITENNRQTQQVLRATDQAVQRLQSIENNTAITAYYSGVAAINSNYLKWAHALNI
jgi:hypothetical protein